MASLGQGVPVSAGKSIETISFFLLTIDMKRNERVTFLK
jgi:hypothetical protein